MVALKVTGFGGMVPAISDKLLPDYAAVESENAWLYSGELIGLPEPTLLHECALAECAKVYRIPANYGEALAFDESLWLEFANAFTDVVRAPVVDDQYDRYYWASTSGAPKYNTRARLARNANLQTATVTFNSSLELVLWPDHGMEVGDPVYFTTTNTMPGGLNSAQVYYISSQSFGQDNFRVSTSLANALGGTSVSLSSNGVGTHTGHQAEMTPWLLGVPQPSAAPACVVTGGAEPVTSRSYVFTYVSEYSEEGPPSNPVTVTGNISGSWDLTFPAPETSDLGYDRYLTARRIYRTVTSSQGEATYYFVAEMDINDLTYSDTALDAEVTGNEEMPSANWFPPPDDLEGWVIMPNGFLVGWRANELWFSVPYRPHAWDPTNTLAMEYPIVGLGVMNQTLVICTTGFPMTGTGVNPEVFSTSKLANFDPCISRGSILSTVEGVYYASVGGLVKVIPGKAELITGNLMSKDKWQTLTQVGALKCVRLGTAIYAFGAANFGIFEETAFDEDAFEQENLTGSLRGFLFDPNNERTALNVLTCEDPTVNLSNDPWSGEVFILRDNKVYWIDQLNPQPVLDPYLWRSKVFQVPEKKNLAAARIFFDVPANTPAQNPVRDNALVQTLSDDQYGLLRTYADGEHVSTHELRTSGELLRLPSGFKADYWQFEIEARVRVFSIEAASSVKELKRV